MKQGADRPEGGRLREEMRNRKESAGGGEGQKKLPVPVGGAGSVIDGGERSGKSLREWWCYRSLISSS